MDRSLIQPRPRKYGECSDGRMNQIQHRTINRMVARFKNERGLDATYDVRMSGNYAYVQFHVKTPDPFPELRVGARGGWWSDVQCRGAEIRSFPNPAMDSLLYADKRLAKQGCGNQAKFTPGAAKPPVSAMVARPASHAPLAANRQQACELLADVARTLFHVHREELEVLKKKYAHDLDEPDFVWRSLVESASGWGNSRGYEGLFGNPESYRKVTFEALSCLSPTDRVSALTATLLAAGVRWHHKKAEQLSENVRRIEQIGGPAAARTKLLSQPTRDAKIAFLERFAGIGPKFARNIFMNPYHPEFHQSIAIDSRIQSISEALELAFRTYEYEKEEQFYLSVAEKAGLSGWELDRLIYNYNDEVLVALRRDAGVGSGGRTSAFCIP